MAGVKFLGYTVFKSNTEREIQALYEERQKVLLEQKQKLHEDISEWRDALIRSIYKHASLQKYYLEQEYSKQIRFLNHAHKTFIRDLHVREEMKKTEEIDQLLEQFKQLKYQLAALAISAESIPFIRVPYKQELKPNRFDDAEIGTNQIDNDSTEIDNNEVKSNVIINPRLNSNRLSERIQQTE